MLTQEQLAEIRQRVEYQVDWMKIDLGDDNFPVEIHESPLYIGGLVCRFSSGPDNIVGNRDADSILQSRADVKVLLEHVAALELERASPWKVARDIANKTVDWRDLQPKRVLPKGVSPFKAIFGMLGDVPEVRPEPTFSAPAFDGCYLEKNEGRYSWWGWHPTDPYWSHSCWGGNTEAEARDALASPNAAGMEIYHVKLIHQIKGAMVEVDDVPPRRATPTTSPKVSE